MQFELYFKKEYVCKIPAKRLKHFRYILRKDNEPTHLLHQVIYITASDIKKIATNLQIYKYFYIIPLFHTGPESNELTRIDKYLDSWLNRTQFVKILTDSHSP